MTHRQVFLDTETTGLSAADGHRIIEIGCVETIDRWLTGNNFHVRLNPGRSIDAEAKRKHGITERDLIGAPVFSDVAEQLCEYLRGAEILMHNATFDVAFLNNEFSLSGRVERMADLGTITDTFALARGRYPGQPVSLDALCRRFEVDTSKRTFHGALIDASLLREVYLAMMGGQEVFELLTERDPRPSFDRFAIQAGGRTEPIRVIEPTDEELEAHTLRMQEIHERQLKNLTGKLKEQKDQQKNIEKQIARIDALPRLIENIGLQLVSISVTDNGSATERRGPEDKRARDLRSELEKLKREQGAVAVTRKDHAATLEALNGLIWAAEERLRELRVRGPNLF